MATFRKYNEDWVVTGDDRSRPGDRVTVDKKEGESVQVTLGELVGSLSGVPVFSLRVNTFVNHKNRWCVSVPGGGSRGDRVRVTKKDGSSSFVLLGEEVGEVKGAGVFAIKRGKSSVGPRTGYDQDEWRDMGYEGHPGGEGYGWD